MKYCQEVWHKLVDWFNSLLPHKHNSNTEIKTVEMHTDYIDEVFCYTDSTTNWDATKGNPFVKNHIQHIHTYKGAKVNFINFTTELHEQYKSLLHEYDYEQFLTPSKKI